MSKEFCSCKNIGNLENVFKWYPPYGWIIVCTELSEENGYTQIHKYGGKISYCPFCGKKLKLNFEEK